MAWRSLNPHRGEVEIEDTSRCVRWRPGGHLMAIEVQHLVRGDGGPDLKLAAIEAARPSADGWFSIELE